MADSGVGIARAGIVAVDGEVVLVEHGRAPGKACSDGEAEFAAGQPDKHGKNPSYNYRACSEAAKNYPVPAGKRLYANVHTKVVGC